MSDDPKNRRRPRVGLAIGSGGLKCFAGIALVELLEELKIPIDHQIGCSGGSIVVGCLGLGWNAKKIAEEANRHYNKEYFSRMNWRALAAMLRIPFFPYKPRTDAFLHGEGLRKMMNDFFGDTRIEQLSPPTSIVATNMNTGRYEVFSEGRLADVAAASSSVYPILPPVEIDGVNYIDGGFRLPIPILPLVKEGMDLIIAISFGNKLESQFSSLLQGLHSQVNGLADELGRWQLATAIQSHHREIINIDYVFPGHLGLADAHRIPEVMQIGRELVEKHREQIAETYAMLCMEG